MKVVLNLLASDLTQAQLINLGCLMSFDKYVWGINGGKLIIETSGDIETIKDFLDTCRVKYTYATFN